MNAAHNKHQHLMVSCHNLNNQAFSILILEDDLVYQRILSFHLAELHYKVQVAGTIDSFWHQLENEKPDLLIIDMRLPDGTGFGVLHQIREKDKLIPILVVSSLDKSVERELAYNSGADVFLVKPVHINELMAVVKRFQSRVSAICEQMIANELTQSNHSECWRLLKAGSFLVGPTGAKLELTATEFAFLEFLALSEQEASRRTIAHYLKSVRLKDSHGYDGALNTMISRLRKRWAEVDSTPLPIRAIRGTGYAFASQGGLTLVKDRRDDHFHRVVLHYFTIALGAETTGLSDLDRAMAKTLYQSLQVAVSPYFLNRAAAICDLMINNSSEDSSDYPLLLQSEEARAQFLVVMIRFIHFLLEAPHERLQWLINALRYDDADCSKPHDRVLIAEDKSEVSQIISFLTQITHYLERLCESEAVLEMIKLELTLVDINHFMARMSAELAELERTLDAFYQSEHNLSTSQI